MDINRPKWTKADQKRTKTGKNRPKRTRTDQNRPKLAQNWHTPTKNGLKLENLMNFISIFSGNFQGI